MHMGMYNTYFISTIYAGRRSSSSSSSDYTNFFCGRFDRTPAYLSSCCGCCNCCALATNKILIRPSLLRGLRQSTLLELSASRRLLLGGGHKCFIHSRGYDLNRVFYELNCSIKERNSCTKCRRTREKKRFCSFSEEDSKIHSSSETDDVESILSLLTEEVDLDFIGVKGKNMSSFKRLEMEKKRKNGRKERNLSWGKEIKVEKQGSLKHNGTYTEELQNGDEIPNDKREAVTKCGKNRKQRNISNCSSYYSFSSSQDFGSDLEVQDKHRQERDEGHYMEGHVKEELNRQSDGLEKLKEISYQERIAFFDRNPSKESEKKPTHENITIEETESKNESLDMHSQAFRINEYNCGEASIFHKEFNGEEDTSASMMDFDMKRRLADIQKGTRRKYLSTKFQESGGGDKLETTLKSQKAFSGRVENLEVSEIFLLETSHENKNVICSITEKDVKNRNSQKLIEKSKIQDTERTTNNELKNEGEDEISILSSFQKMEEEHHQKGKIIGQSEERRKSQGSSELHVHNGKLENTSIISSRTRIKNLEENRSLSSDANGIFIQTDKMMTPSIKPREGSELVNNISESYSSDEKQVSTSQSTSDTVRIIQKSKLTSIFETRESHCQTNERITQFNSSSEAQGTTNLSISGENASKMICSFQGSLNMVSEAREHVILADDNERSSEVMLVPSSSQLAVKGSAHVESTGITSPEVCPQTSESGSSTLYDNSKRKGHALPYKLGYRDGSVLGYSEPSNVVAPEVSVQPEISKETGKPIVKRTGRFLWNIIADFVQLRRASHADASNSAARSGERSSSNKSDSETCISRQENEETNKSNLIMVRTSDQPQAKPSIKLKPKESDTQSEGQASDTMKLKDKVKHLEVGMSSTSTLASGSSSSEFLFAFGEGNTNQTGGEKDLQVTTSGVENLEMSIPLPAGGPPFVEEIVDTGKSDVPRTESSLQIKETVSPTQTESIGIEGNNREWKQKRLQRKKQVVRDKFDEWEEAYTIELEQRKMDEEFMREAISEAQKAGDKWEVPVGAVLVQHGKIIARGCNL